MKTIRYGIIDGDGGSIANGLSEQSVWTVAQRAANERQAPVCVWIDGDRKNGPEWWIDPERYPNRCDSEP